jgi:Co/Zn/Cd efflux system component
LLNSNIDLALRETLDASGNSIGVICAGLLVNWLNSSKPDLIIGSIVFVIVIRGALRILKLGK